MKVEVSRIGFDGFQTEIYNMLKLFLENLEVVYEYADDADYRITIRSERNEAGDGIVAEAILIREYRSGEQLEKTEKTESGVTGDIGNLESAAVPAQRPVTWSERHERKLTSNQSEQIKRTQKRAIGFAMLRVLERATGLHQPWGILTGVRPTKLMHNMRMLHTREQCMHILQEDYLVTEPKVRLLTEIVDRQLQVIPDMFALDDEVSIYIGIPFCPTKCAYCTFPAYDIRGNNGSVNAFLEGLHYEIREIGRWLRETGLGITTIYWGGGTPTSITAEDIDALFITMHESFPGMDRVRELTVEAGRPDTITEDKIRVLQKWNVDRISINPQSFTQETLDSIGRHHTVKETVEKFQLAHDMGLDNINMDLIIGLPDEGVEQFGHTLAETAKLLPESLTVHTLSFKRASKMTQNRDEYEVAERSEIIEMMDMATAFTERHGYYPYYMYRQKNMLGNLENVGYALEGKESPYNILMMEERQTIIGLGCGAVSKILFPAEPGLEEGESRRIERFPNPKEPSVYNQAYKEYISKKIKLMDEAYRREPAL